MRFRLLNTVTWVEVARKKDKEACHQNNNWDKERCSSVHESGEGIVTPLDDWNLVIEVKIRNAMALVGNREFEDSKTLRRAEHGWIDSIILVGQWLSDVWLKHYEFKLKVVSDKRTPFSFHFLFYRNEILNSIFDEVIFWVLCIKGKIWSFFLMVDISDSQHSCFLKCPFSKFFAETSVVGVDRCEKFIWAHRKASSQNRSMIVPWLIPSDKSKLFTAVDAWTTLLVDWLWLCAYFTMEYREHEFVCRVKCHSDSLNWNSVFHMERFSSPKRLE